MENTNTQIQITKTDDTKVKYLYRALQLSKKAHNEMQLGSDEEIDPRQLVYWLEAYKKNISRASWRLYKSAIVYYLETHHDIDAAMEALEFIVPKDATGCLKDSTKTSSQKLKKIPVEDWEKLDNFLKSKNNKWHAELRAWLRSSIITGLRPIEWKNTKFFMYDDKQPALLVENAKHTNGRAHGITRTLILEDVTSDDLFAIKNHLNNVRTFDGMGEYDLFYDACSSALYYACRKLWPRRKKHITLYSARHQFSANAKNSGMTKKAIAAMMGHAVDITATIHYGRKQAGYETTMIKPISEEEERVREIDVENVANIIQQKKDNLL